MEATLASEHRAPGEPSALDAPFEEALETLLAGRSYLYRLGQRLFGDEPDEDLLREALSPLALEALGLFVDLEAGEAAAAVRVLDTACASFDARSEAFADDARAEYTRLFLGPGTLPSPPWESAHVSSDRTLFNAATLEVRRFYASRGFRPREYPHVADDHLALELDFLAALSQESLVALRAGDFDSLRALLRDQREFLHAHPMRWVESFVTQMSQSPTKTGKPDPAMPYAAFASLAAAFVAGDAEAVDDILDALEQPRKPRPTGR